MRASSIAATTVGTVSSQPDNHLWSARATAASISVPGLPTRRSQCTGRADRVTTTIASVRTVHECNVLMTPDCRLWCPLANTPTTCPVHASWIRVFSVDLPLGIPFFLPFPPRIIAYGCTTPPSLWAHRSRAPHRSRGDWTHRGSRPLQVRRGKRARVCRRDDERSAQLRSGPTRAFCPPRTLGRSRVDRGGRLRLLAGRLTRFVGRHRSIVLSPRPACEDRQAVRARGRHRRPFGDARSHRL